MFTNFAALTRLPLADATAISFASPLITVALPAIVLKERVRIYRWSAVLVGFAGVMVMLIPHFDVGHYAGAGAAPPPPRIAVRHRLGFLQRRHRDPDAPAHAKRDHALDRVLFFARVRHRRRGHTAIRLAHADRSELLALIALGVLGGIAHILLTESYRHATASVVAPFDYTSMLWALLLGYWVFGELPSALVYVGGAIVAGAGLFVIWRERQLGVQRPPEAEGPRRPEI